MTTADANGPKRKKVRVFIDATSNIYRNLPDGKERFKADQHTEVDRHLDDMFVRQTSLDPLMVQTGAFVDLLNEARVVFVKGCFTSCVAMCGITAERILKDILLGSISGPKARKTPAPDEKAASIIIANYLLGAKAIDKKLFDKFRALATLRNAYAHASGKKPQQDAGKAVEILHEIIEETVDMFRFVDLAAKVSIPPKQ